MLNRKWILRATGPDIASRFEYEEEDQDFTLGENQVLVKQEAFLCVPSQRLWLDASPIPGMEKRLIAQSNVPMASITAGVVAESRSDRLPVGRKVGIWGSWQDYAVVDAGKDVADITMDEIRVLPDDMALAHALGRYGPNPRTAYVGLVAVGKPQEGDTVVVSAAAGSTGSMVAQIAKILGCRVIGIAGGQKKCDWLKNTLKVDGVIDYKKADVADQVKERCPDGIDVFFDNVGGEILAAAMENMALGGRVVICGQISEYDRQGSPYAQDLMLPVYRNFALHGFSSRSHNPIFTKTLPEADAKLTEWTEAGLLQHREDVREGFDKLPTVFAELFSGANNGTLIVRT